MLGMQREHELLEKKLLRRITQTSKQWGLLEDGDKVITRARFSGTHEGEFMGHTWQGVRTVHLMDEDGLCVFEA